MNQGRSEAKEVGKQPLLPSEISNLDTVNFLANQIFESFKSSL
jgi:hypothetical protein